MKKEVDKKKQKSKLSILLKKWIDIFLFRADKHRVAVNLVMFTILFYIIYDSIDWEGVWYFILNAPTEFKLFVKNTIRDFLAFVEFFLHQSASDWYYLAGIGILKRIVLENYIIAFLVKYFFVFTGGMLLTYLMLERKELKKVSLAFQSSVATLIITPVVSFLTYFIGAKMLITFTQNVLLNQVWSFLKFLIFKAIPAMLVWSLNLPIVAEIIEYIILIIFFKSLSIIPGAEDAFNKFVSFLKRIWVEIIIFFIIFDFPKIKKVWNSIFDTYEIITTKIRNYFRSKTVPLARNTRNYLRKKINKILSSDTDYLILGKSYKFIHLNKMLKLIKRFKQIRKRRRNDAIKAKFVSKVDKLKSIVNKIKRKVKKEEIEEGLKITLFSCLIFGL